MNTCPNVAPADGGVTVMAAVPLCPSLMAVIVAEPATTPLTSPLELTVATAVLLLDHAIGRPDSGLPAASFGVAVSWSALPAGTLAELGLTVTDATGTCTTVMAAVPLCPSLVAVIVAEPATLPVTSPLELTVATDVLELAHVTTRPDNGLPLPSFGVAVSCTVRPAFTEAAAPPLTSPVPVTVATDVLLLAQVTTRPASGLPLASFGVAVSCTVCPADTEADAGLTVTELTGTGMLDTVMLEVPLCPSLVAVIVAEPAVPPVTSPLPSTPATDVLLLDHVTVRPASAVPLASFGVAVSCTV